MIPDSSLSLQDIARAIAPPLTLTADDGRVFCFEEWTPTVKTGPNEPIRVAARLRCTDLPYKEPIESEARQ